jgi:NADH-quinone oxidoreductase subunit C
MSESLDLTLSSLTSAGLERGVSADGIELMRVNAEALPSLVDALLRAGFGRFVDLTVVDTPGRPDRFELQYLFHSMEEQRWLRLKTRTAGQAPSIVDRVSSANWYEREAFDMFGVQFTGHPELTRILMPDDWDGYPLRRDVAIGGEPVEFTEDSR